MSHTITRRQLRKEGEAVRGPDRGESDVGARNGALVGELTPVHRRGLVLTEVVVGAFRNAPRVEAKRFRQDVDAVVDQSAAPRG
jgi:hypothetical protein